MRFSGFLAPLVACLAFAGCASSPSIDSLALVGPSQEKTSSIRPNAPVPRAVVGLAEEQAAEQESVAEATSEVEEAVAENAAAPDPETKPLALIDPKPKVSQAAFAVGQVSARRFRDAKPINFGKASPKNLAVHGVDVSRWQGDIDWAKLRSQGANFAYIKATDGGDHLDPMFRKNWKAAANAGLRRGAYHFFYWCRTAGEQADWFIRNVPRVEGALPPVIDVEWNGESRCRKRPSPEKVREKMQVFMDKLEAHYGQRPIIYTAPDFYRDNLRGAFPNHPFWLRAVAQHPSKVYPGRKWVFWQYSGSGLSHGVDGRIDLNVFHGSEAEWRRWVARETS